MKSILVLSLCAALCACGGGGGGSEMTPEQIAQQQQVGEYRKEAEGLFLAQAVLADELQKHPSGDPERIPFADAWNHNAERLVQLFRYTCPEFNLQSQEWQLCMERGRLYSTSVTY